MGQEKWIIQHKQKKLEHQQFNKQLEENPRVHYPWYTCVRWVWFAGFFCIFVDFFSCWEHRNWKGQLLRWILTASFECQRNPFKTNPGLITARTSDTCTVWCWHHQCTTTNWYSWSSVVAVGYPTTYERVFVHTSNHFVRDPAILRGTTSSLTQGFRLGATKITPSNSRLFLWNKYIPQITACWLLMVQKSVPNPPGIFFNLVKNKINYL